MICGSSRLPGRVEGEGNFAIAGLFRLGDVAVISGHVAGLFFFQASKEKITSSGVTGVPSCHLASGRNR